MLALKAPFLVTSECDLDLPPISALQFNLLITVRTARAGGGGAISDLGLK